MEGIMQTAKIFTNGRSQAVRLPKDFRFADGDVFIKKIGNIVLLIPKNITWESWWENMEKAPADFMEERNQPAIQQREGF